MNKNTNPALLLMRTLTEALAEATDDEDMKTNCAIMRTYDDLFDTVSDTIQYCVIDDEGGKKVTTEQKKVLLAFLLVTKDTLDEVRKGLNLGD